MKKEMILSMLLEGELHLEGQFMYGSNYTFMVNCTCQGQSLKAVYKPLRGEQPLWDFPSQSLAHREVAAYLVSEALGWDLVPETVFRSEGAPMGAGSLQVFIPHDPEVHYFTFNETDRGNFPKVMLFDLLINNADRKGGHLLIDPEGSLKLIDHGLSFHIEDKLRTVLWDHAGEVIPADLLADTARVSAALTPENSLYRTLQVHLHKDEIEALRQRTQTLVEEGVFPHPPEDRRAYPWPLV
jgi:hypothetical protein